MSHNVFANSMEVSAKASSGKTICNFPDVCFTPPLTPATPPGVPIPYPNTGMASDTTDGSSTVKISDQEVMLKNKSCFKQSTGDEAGSAPKKGVVTSKNKGKVYFNAWSMDVKVEGENVPRNLDITTNNHMSKMPGNTPPMPHVSSLAIVMPPTVPPCKAAPAKGSPVNPLLGCKVLSGDDELDFRLEGPLDLVWQRQYFSDNSRVGWLGQGWSLPLEVSAELNENETVIVDSQGRRIACPHLGVGEGVYLPSERSWVRRPECDRIVWDMPEGVSMLFASPEQNAVVGSSHWPLCEICDRNGNVHSIKKIDDRTRRIDVSNGDTLRLEFDSRGRLTSVVRVGPTIVFEAVPDAVLVRYLYDEAGDLREVCDRAGVTWRRFTWHNHILNSHTTAAGLEAHYEWDQPGSQWTRPALCIEQWSASCSSTTSMTIPW